jgi:hypothetical protein
MYTLRRAKEYKKIQKQYKNLKNNKKIEEPKTDGMDSAPNNNRSSDLGFQFGKPETQSSSLCNCGEPNCPDTPFVVPRDANSSQRSQAVSPRSNEQPAYQPSSPPIQLSKSARRRLKRNAKKLRNPGHQNLPGDSPLPNSVCKHAKGKPQDPEPKASTMAPGDNEKPNHHFDSPYEAEVMEFLNENLIQPLQWIANELRLLKAKWVVHSDVANLIDWSILDYVIEANKTVTREKQSAFASAFQNAPFQNKHKAKMHTHAQNAADRTAAIDTMLSISDTTRRKPLDVQSSNYTAEKGIAALRTPVWWKDLDKKPTVNFDTDGVDGQPNYFFWTMVDVEYYLKMDQLLSENPMVLWTMQPSKPCFQNEHYGYYFDKQNVCHLNVNGGSDFHSKIWDYNQEIFVATGFTDWWNLFSYRTNVVKVYKRQVTDDWALVCLTPIYHTNVIGSLAIKLKAFLYPGSFEPKPLEQYHPNDGTSSVIKTVGENGIGYWIANGEGPSYTPEFISQKQFDSIMAFKARPNTTLSHASLMTRINKPEETYKGDLACVLNNNEHVQQVTAGYPTAHYTVPTIGDVKPMMIDIMPPVIQGECYVPAGSIANAKYAIEERIISVKSTVENDVQLRSWFKDFLKEFPTKQHPQGYEDVAKKQNRPNQKKALMEGLDNPDDYVLVNGCFMKKEAYLDQKAPRIITTAKSVHKVHYARFQMAIGDIFKNFDWYAFGKTPKEIANIVANICSNSTRSVQVGDFRRMDGAISPFVRELELIFLLHVFDPIYHGELRKLHSEAYNQRCYLMDLVFEQEFARGSGNPETSNFNSLLSRFIIYCCYRHMKMTHDDAWKMPAVVGGDDSLSSDLPDETFAYIASRFGQTAKVKTIKRDSLGVNFLSRFYGYGVWKGEPDSTCDIPRTLSKFHTTVNLPTRTPDAMEKRAIEKAYSSYLTDENTPLVGDLMAAVLQRDHKFAIKLRAQPVDVDKFRDASWWSQYKKQDQFPNRYDTWMDDYLAYWKLDEVKDEVLKEAVEQLRNCRWENLNFKPIRATEELKIEREIEINGETFKPEQPAKPVENRPKEGTKKPEGGKPKPTGSRQEKRKEWYAKKKTTQNKP